MAGETALYYTGNIDEFSPKTQLATIYLYTALASAAAEATDLSSEDVGRLVGMVLWEIALGLATEGVATELKVGKHVGQAVDDALALLVKRLGDAGDAKGVKFLQSLAGNPRFANAIKKIAAMLTGMGDELSSADDIARRTAGVDYDPTRIVEESAESLRWWATDAKGLRLFEAAIADLQRKFKAAGGKILWDPNREVIRDGKRILGEFDSVTKTIRLYAGANRAKLGHELRHFQQAIDAKIFGKRSFSLIFKHLRELDVELWLRQFGLRPGPSNSNDFGLK